MKNMNTKIKHRWVISLSFVICHLSFSFAQQSDSVQVAFRSVAPRDLLGGVSVVDMQEQNTKNYTTYSLDNMQSLVGGYNGGLWNQGEVLALSGQM